jgi:uncharacterized protein Yka (UPF0111/DUF47 family)
MSYALFDKGLTSNEVKKWKQTNTEETELMKQLNRWKESETVLNFLRKIRANERTLDKMELALWQKATKRRTLP